MLVALRLVVWGERWLRRVLRRSGWSARGRALDAMPWPYQALTRWWLQALNAGQTGFPTLDLTRVAAGRSCWPLLLEFCRFTEPRAHGRCFVGRGRLSLGRCMPACGQHRLILALDPRRLRLHARSRRQPSVAVPPRVDRGGAT